MKIFLLFIIFFNLSYAASRHVRFPDDGGTPDRRSTRTHSTASSSAGMVEFIANIWNNILTEDQRETFSSRFSSSEDHFKILRSFYDQYNVEKNKLSAAVGVTIGAILRNMGLSGGSRPMPSRVLRTPESFTDESDEDNEDDSERRLKVLWPLIENTPRGRLINACDPSSSFKIFCHLYDASFNDLTRDESSSDVNGFMVIENIFTTDPSLRIKDRLLAQAVLALRNAEREEHTSQTHFSHSFEVESPRRSAEPSPAPRRSSHHTDLEASKTDNDTAEPLLGKKEKPSNSCCSIL